MSLVDNLGGIGFDFNKGLISKTSLKKYGNMALKEAYYSFVAASMVSLGLASYCIFNEDLTRCRISYSNGAEVEEVIARTLLTEDVQRLFLNDIVYDPYSREVRKNCFNE